MRDGGDGTRTSEQAALDVSKPWLAGGYIRPLCLGFIVQHRICSLSGEHYVRAHPEQLSWKKKNSVEANMVRTQNCVAS